MEFEQLQIGCHLYPSAEDIRDLEYSASIEEHQYWTQLGDHAACSQQDFYMARTGLHNEDQAHISNRQDLPSRGQGRSRSPEARSHLSPNLRRSQRLMSRTARETSQSQEQSFFNPYSQEAGPSSATRPALEDSTRESISVIQSALPRIPHNGTIIVSLDPRPPLEVRTGISIPRLTVRVTVMDSGSPQISNVDLNSDIGALHAVVSLWSADGRGACPHAVPPMLTGRKDATLANVVSTQLTERRAEAVFSNLAITRPGHYRIRISIMETPLPDRDEDGDASIGSPRQLLSIETRPIHAHGFAPMILS